MPFSQLDPPSLPSLRPSPSFVPSQSRPLPGQSPSPFSSAALPRPTNPSFSSIAPSTSPTVPLPPLNSASPHRPQPHSMFNPITASNTLGPSLFDAPHPQPARQDNAFAFTTSPTISRPGTAGQPLVAVTMGSPPFAHASTSALTMGGSRPGTGSMERAFSGGFPAMSAFGGSHTPPFSLSRPSTSSGNPIVGAPSPNAIISGRSSSGTGPSPVGSAPPPPTSTVAGGAGTVGGMAGGNNMHMPTPPPQASEVSAVSGGAGGVTSPPTDEDIEAIIHMATSAGRAGAAPRDTRTQLFVGNLPYRIRWQDLKDLFRRAGTVLRADVSLGPDNRSRGYGTVVLATAEDAGRAVDMFNGYEWMSRVLEVRPDRMGGAAGLGPGMAAAAGIASSLVDEGFGTAGGMVARPGGGGGGAPFGTILGAMGTTPTLGATGVAGDDELSGRCLFVGNLPFHIQWQDLKDLFRLSGGSIVRADVALGIDGRSRGFGMVIFANEADAEKARGMFNGYEYNGRTLKVHFDKYGGLANLVMGLTPGSSSSSTPNVNASSLANSIIASGIPPGGFSSGLYPDFSSGLASNLISHSVAAAALTSSSTSPEWVSALTASPNIPSSTIAGASTTPSSFANMATIPGGPGGAHWPPQSSSALGPSSLAASAYAQQLMFNHTLVAPSSRKEPEAVAGGIDTAADARNGLEWTPPGSSTAVGDSYSRFRQQISLNDSPNSAPSHGLHAPRMVAGNSSSSSSASMSQAAAHFSDVSSGITQPIDKHLGNQLPAALPPPFGTTSSRGPRPNTSAIASPGVEARTTPALASFQKSSSSSPSLFAQSGQPTVPTPIDLEDTVLLSPSDDGRTKGGHSTTQEGAKQPKRKPVKLKLDLASPTSASDEAKGSSGRAAVVFDSGDEETPLQGPKHEQQPLALSEPPTAAAPLSGVPSALRSQLPRSVQSQSQPSTSHHHHHPGPITLPPPQPVFPIQPAHSLSPYHHPQAHLPGMSSPGYVSPLYPPVQMGITPHGLPPITPSMPSFTFLPPPQASPRATLSPAALASPTGYGFSSEGGGEGGANASTSPPLHLPHHFHPPLSPSFLPSVPGAPSGAYHQHPAYTNHQHAHQHAYHAYAHSHHPLASAYPHPHMFSPFSPFSPGVAISPGAVWNPAEVGAGSYPGAVGSGTGAPINPAVGAPIHLPAPPTRVMAGATGMTKPQASLVDTQEGILRPSTPKDAPVLGHPHLGPAGPTGSRQRQEELSVVATTGTITARRVSMPDEEIGYFPPVVDLPPTQTQRSQQVQQIQGTRYRSQRQEGGEKEEGSDEGGTQGGYAYGYGSEPESYFPPMLPPLLPRDSESAGPPAASKTKSEGKMPMRGVDDDYYTATTTITKDMEALRVGDDNDDVNEPIYETGRLAGSVSMGSAQGQGTVVEFGL